MKTKGFTLIEVMVVIAIIGILAAIAMPSYTEYIRRGQLSEGVSSVGSYQTKMEHFYQNNMTYSNGGACGINTTNASTGLKYFAVTCNTDGQTYTTTVTGNKAHTTGYSYTVNELGVKTTVSPKGTFNCWTVKNEC